MQCRAPTLGQSAPLTSSPRDADGGHSWKEGCMSTSQLPERAYLEYLKKLAKDRLAALRQTDPRAKLATALLAVARDHGFSSWRALKVELELRQTTSAAPFFDACAKGDVDAVRAMLVSDPSLVRASIPNSPFNGWTGLHEAA